LRETRIGLPGPLEAARVLIRHYAVNVARRSLTPRSGVGPIAHVYRQVEYLLSGERSVGEALGINPLIAAHYEYYDLPCSPPP